MKRNEDRTVVTFPNGERIEVWFEIMWTATGSTRVRRERELPNATSQEA